MRYYIRLKKCLETNKIIKDHFITFKIENYQLGGVGFDENFIARKFWLANYQTQLDYIEKIKHINQPKIFHFVGWFPESKQIQIYWYHKNNDDISKKLLKYSPDYFGSSITYNEIFQPIKRNDYAIRVPITQCNDIIQEFGLNVTTIKWLNISYRSNEEVAISYLNHQIDDKFLYSV